MRTGELFTVPKGLDPAGVCGGPYSSPIGSSAEDQSQEHGRGDSTRPPSVLFTVEPSTCSVCVRRVVLGGGYGMRRARCGRSRVAMFGKTSGELVLAFWVRVCVSRVEWESSLWQTLWKVGLFLGGEVMSHL